MDVKTLFIINILISLFMSCAVFYYMSFVKSYKGVGWWATSEFLFAVFFAMVISRFFLKNPLVDFVSIVLANTGTSCVLIIRLNGIRKFFGRKNISMAYIIIPAIMLGILSYFYFVINSLQIRTFFISTALAFVSLVIAWEFIISRNLGIRRFSYLMTGLYIFFSGINAARGIYILTDSAYQFTLSLPIDIAFFTILPVFDVTVNMCFMLLIAQRSYYGLETALNDKVEFEKALEKSEHDLREVLENSRDALYRRSYESESFEYMSPASSDILGYTSEEMRSMAVSEVLGRFHPDDVERCKDVLAKARAEGGGPYQLDFRFMTKAGDYRWVSDKFFMAGKFEGKALYRFGTLRDVSEYKTLESTLRASEGRFRTLFRSTPNIVGLTTLDEGRYIDVNDNFEKYLGWRREEVIGHTSKELGIFRDYSERLRMADLIRENGSINNYQCEMLTKSKDIRICEVSGEVLVVDEKPCLLLEVADITERKRAEEELRESEKRFRQLVEQSFNPIGIHKNGIILFSNPAGERMLNVARPDQYIGKSILDFCHPDSHETILKRRQEFEEGKDLSPMEIKLINADGDIRDVIVTAGRVTFEGEDATMNIYHDITERKRMEEKIRLAGAYNRSLIEASPDPLVTIGHDGRITDVNTSTELATGYSREELIGTDFSEYFTEPDKARAGYREVFEKGAVKDYPLEIRNRDGSAISVLYNATVYRDELGGASGVFAAARDITELKRAEELLRRSEEMYRTLIQVSPDPIVIYDTSGRCLFASDKTVEMFGLGSREEALGENVLDWIIPEDVERAVSNISLLLSGVPVVMDEYIAVKKNGSTFPVEANGTVVLDQTGSPSRIFAVIRDVSDRKSLEDEKRRLQERLYQTQKFESLSVLAGGVAHDFNNILMGIIGNADVGLMDVSHVSPVRPVLENIKRSSFKAADLCNKMLAYSGDGRFVNMPLNLAELVGEMTGMLKSSIGGNVRLKLSLNTEIPMIEADVNQIQQMVLNLVVNASEAIGENGGSIKISTGTMDIDRQYLEASMSDDGIPGGLYVCLDIADDGCGMDRTVQGKIFEPFFSTKFTGRGLGLSAVLGIVRGHRGAIRVYSEPGKGTCFKVLFPALT